MLAVRFDHRGEIIMMRAIVAASLLLGAVTGTLAQTQTDYPRRSVKIVVPFPAGGPVDAVARTIAAELQDKLGQPMVIDNRAGSVGTLATNLVAKSPPDGYTLVMTIGAHTIVPALMQKLPYDPATDLVGVSAITRTPNLLVVLPDYPAKTLADLVRMAKEKPNTITYSTAGYGSTTHIMTTMLERAAGVSLIHVPYQGGGQSMQAGLGGHVAVAANLSNIAMPFLQAGQARGLAVAGKERSPLFPDIPTFAESGYPDVRGDSWIGMLAPAGTPKEIIEKLQGTISAALNRPSFRDNFLRQGSEVMNLDPAAFDALIKAELEIFAKLAKDMNLKM
jgi:tripartite-type tricarboxylate transporter receptor subunit TctC